MKIFIIQKHLLSFAALMLTASCLLAQPLSVTIVSFTNVSCNNVCNGTAAASVLGGVPPYNYQWADTAIIVGETNSSITGLCAGDYAIVVTDNSGSVDSATVTITEPPILTSSITNQTDVTCANACNGTATVTPIGGTIPYTYLWLDGVFPLNPSQTDSMATNLCADTFIVQIEDTNGCISVSSTTITEPAPLGINLNSMTPAQCVICDGSASVSASGGIPPYTYLWNDTYTQTTSLADSLCTSTYGATVTDANGCVTTLNVIVTGPGGFFSFIDTTGNTTCAGSCDGQAVVMGSGGSPPYTYDWISSLPDTVFGGTDSSITNLCADSYFTMVTDNNACISTVPIFTIVDPPIFSANITDSNSVTCFGDSDGTATVTIINGISPYNYVWSSGGSTIGSTDSTNTETGLSPGTYSVTVTDFKGCTANDSVVISTPLLLTAPITDSTNASCESMCNGSATVAPGGGTPPYSYLWDAGNPLNDSATSGLCAGTHTVTVTDTNGCSTITAVTITEPPALLSVTTDSALVSCNGGCDGNATLMITGGVSPYTYLWSNGDTDSIADSLCAGYHLATVTDSNNCVLQDSVLITEPSPLAVSTTDSTAVCEPLCDGNATATLVGGTSPYSYLWVNGDTLALTDSLCSGTYQLTVTDANGCTVTDSVTILSDTIPVVANAGVDVDVCLGASTILAAIGGVSYSWSPSAELSCDSCPNPELTPSSTSTYTLVVMNIACLDSDQVIITVNECLVELLPEIITPNDDGTNDVFEIPNIEQFPDNRIVIFNQWGDVVFSTNQYHNVNNYWDGKTNNGKRLPDGTYFYVLELGNGNKPISGPVMIHR